MFAYRQIIDDPADVVPVPPELRHRRIEVIFIALESAADERVTTLASLAGCWQGDDLERPPQGDYEVRREFD